MPLMFNTLLHEAGLAAADVRLLRHQDVIDGKTVHRLWHDDRDVFEDYQSGQDATQCARFAAPYWASFVAAPDRETLFVGLYQVGAVTNVVANDTSAEPGAKSEPITTDRYTLSRLDLLSEYAGLLYISWGDGARSWVQRADYQNKRVVELRRDIKAPAFPGFAKFVSQLSDVENFPSTWECALMSARGIYLLTCPRTNEQYVGAATGAGGFLARWIEYARTGHGGNVALKSRDPNDYRVSILEVAGSASSVEEILAMEALWKAKLQSREMGLNRN